MILQSGSRNPLDVAILQAAGGGPGGAASMPTTADALMAERLRKAQQQVSALKERIAGLRQAKEDDIDWETVGKASVDKYSFSIRRALRGHWGKIYACDWAGDDVTALSASQDGKLIVWNAFTENKRDVIRLKSPWVMSCAYEKDDDRLVACGGLDNIVSVFDLKAKQPSGHHEPHMELQPHNGYIADIKFRGSDSLMSASGDGCVYLWDLHSGQQRAHCADHSADVMSIAPHPHDQNIFATGSCDKTVMVWDLRTAKSVLCFTGHVSDVNAVDWFPDGNAVASGSDDSSCRLFDIRACAAVNIFTEERIQCGVTDIQFSRSGRLLLAAYEEPMVIAWENISREGTFHELKGHRKRISCLAVNGSGQALMTGSWDTELAVWA